MHRGMTEEAFFRTNSRGDSEGNYGMTPLHVILTGFWPGCRFSAKNATIGAFQSLFLLTAFSGFTFFSVQGA